MSFTHSELLDTLTEGAHGLGVEQQEAPYDTSYVKLVERYDDHVRLTFDDGSVYALTAQLISHATERPV